MSPISYDCIQHLESSPGPQILHQFSHGVNNERLLSLLRYQENPRLIGLKVWLPSLFWVSSPSALSHHLRTSLLDWSADALVGDNEPSSSSTKRRPILRFTSSGRSSSTSSGSVNPYMSLFPAANHECNEVAPPRPFR